MPSIDEIGNRVASLSFPLYTGKQSEMHHFCVSLLVASSDLNQGSSEKIMS